MVGGAYRSVIDSCGVVSVSSSESSDSAQVKAKSANLFAGQVGGAPRCIYPPVSVKSAES